MKKEEYDAIVVGSGISGGWAAKELTEKGLKVLMLERGRNVEHGKDYITEHKAPWEYTYRGRGERQLYKREYQTQSKCYAFGEPTKHFFVNDKDNPYTTPEDKPFTWIRGYHLGGRSLMWGRQVYRMSDLDFSANLKDGHGVDWPIRYKDIEKWYDYVERFIGISGQAEKLPQLPDGQFMSPMEMNCVEKAVREGIGAKYTDRLMTIGRCAVLTRPHKGRAACHYCGPCERGCSTGSYFSTQSSTLPAAVATGNLTIRADSPVHSVIYNEEKSKAEGVRVVDAATGDLIEFKSRIVFLCASALGSTQILLNTTSSDSPDGLGNQSGELGHNLMDHHFQLGAFGDYPGFEDKYYYGNRPNGIYVPRFQNIKSTDRNYLRGYGMQGGAGRRGWSRGMSQPGFGATFKESLRTPGPWQMNFMAFGECLPRHDNHVALNHDKKDSVGLPTLHINCSWGENELAMRKDMKLQAAEMLEASGAKNVVQYENENAPGLGIHEMGTARMGRDPRTSVLNGFNQVHQAQNVFVTDGACMTSSGCQNPSITYMALTARACDYAVQQLKRGDL